MSGPGPLTIGSGRRAPVLVIGIGNPARGDDAIGPALAERLEAAAPDGVEVLADYQLQVEHALDLRDRRVVVFADAAASGCEPFSLAPVAPAPEACYSTHAISPAALLFHFRALFDAPLKAFLLAIRGYEFSLGAPLSAGAARNLAAALDHLLDFVRRGAQSPSDAPLARAAPGSEG
jgi:hydrogenase maturation protease